ncbi:MAG: hypothetical protein IJZ90_02785 [Clostridia bacterium]|nr:hypothetical protein [Clostridia bacterium]
MCNEFFSKAKAIFVQDDTKEFVVSCGYRADFNADKNNADVKVKITGRSFYRLYINGEIVMHGPARTAKGYLRVDEIDIGKYVRSGNNAVAIEQISYGKPFGGYSNDITLEDGVIIFEIFGADGSTLAFSSENTPCIMLKNRHKKTDRKSHCREVCEVWDVDENYFEWRCGEVFSDFNSSTEIAADFKLLPREMLYPDMKYVQDANLAEFGTFNYEREYELRFHERVAEDYYKTLDGHLLKDLGSICEHAGDIKLDYIQNGVSLNVKENAYLMYDFRESHVGFVGLTVKTDKDIRIDIVATELMDTDGTNFLDFNTGTRLYIKAGEYSFVHFEPALARYIRLYITGEANVSITNLNILTYSYPDLREGYFMCSDDDVNRLYNAARKTLILNTLDIFMDCPDRERGGWLCDSFWTARAAALMLGDTKVEKAFIENFLLTDASLYKYGFFPSVYPNSSPGYPCDEISTWSFWLLAEIAEYVKRSGDFELVKKHKARIDAFIDGALTLKGESGLLENLPIVFIDWSQSNNPANTRPISVPANALFAYALREYAAVMGDTVRAEIAEAMTAVLKEAVSVCNEKDRLPDSLTYADGKFTDNGVYSEAAHFTTLWSELMGTGVCGELRSRTNTVKLNVIDKMGPAPKYRAHPNIGKSGLFIGDCVRFDMLVKLGRIETMFDELKAIFYPQLQEGPGTLWENEVIEATSRCHGFNAHVGVHLTRDILGLNPVDEVNKTLVITPHPANLRWARGVEKTKAGCISVSFVSVNGRFELKAVVPSCYKCSVELPPYIAGLSEDNIKIDVRYV